MATIDQSLFDKEAFRQWLEEQPKETVVGVAGYCWQCPLARWLNTYGLMAEINAENAIITDGGTPMFPRKQAGDLPRWAKQFVFNVDQAARKRRSPRLLVSKEEALEALAQ